MINWGKKYYDRYILYRWFKHEKYIQREHATIITLTSNLEKPETPPISKCHPNWLKKLTNLIWKKKETEWKKWLTTFFYYISLWIENGEVEVQLSRIFIVINICYILQWLWGNNENILKSNGENVFLLLYISRHHEWIAPLITNHDIFAKS